MRIVATSDWHGQFPNQVPDGDVLVLAGDMLPNSDHLFKDHDKEVAFQDLFLRRKLIPFLNELPHLTKILVAGNHDFLFTLDDTDWRAALTENGVSYLQDQRYGRFWGSPWSVFLPRWAYMLPEEQLANKWALIPADCDTWIIHGPPYGAGDFTVPLFGSANVGSRTLRQRVVELGPKRLICGHIHEAFGKAWLGAGTEVLNVSLVDENYVVKNDPVVIDDHGGEEGRSRATE